MTGAAWRRLRELLVSGRGQDRTDSADESAEEDGGTSGRPAEPDPVPHAPVPPGSVERIVGCFAVLIALFALSAPFVVFMIVSGSWDISGRTVARTAASLVVAMLAAALAWRAGSAWQRGRKGPTGATPPVERTEDDQNSVGKP